jgi:transcriptional regulator with XRE-family HTH domain
MHTFAGNLKKAREAKGWTQAKAATKIGIKHHNLSAYEEGRSTPCPITFAKIARGFGITDIGFADNKDFKLSA